MDACPRPLGLPAWVWILLLATALRVGAVATQPMGVEIDGLGYWCMASSWVDGQGLVDNFGNRAFLNPGYALFLAPLFALFGTHLAVAVYANVVLGVLSVGLCYGLGRRLAGPRAGLLAAFLWAVYPHALVYGTYVAKENLQVPLLLGIVWAGWAWVHQPRRWSLGLLVGGLSGAMALVSATGLVFGLFFATWWVGGQVLRGIGRQAGTWKGALLWGIGFLLVVSPWMLRNQRVLGTWALNTNGGLNLLLGNRAEAEVNFKGLEGTGFQEDWTRIRAEGGEVAANEAARTEAWMYIRAHPGKTLSRMGERWIAFWTPPRRVDRSLGTVEWGLRLVWWAQFLAMFAAALIAWRRPRIAGPVWILLGLYAFAHAPFFVMPRFQLPAIPLLCVLTGVAMLAARRQNPELASPELANPELEPGKPPHSA